MDLNYLFHRRGISVHNASIAACLPSRKAHRGLAAAYGRMIAEARVARTGRRP